MNLDGSSATYWGEFGGVNFRLRSYKGTHPIQRRYLGTPYPTGMGVL